MAPLAYDPAVGTWSPTGALVNLPAIFIIILITILLVVGIRELAKVNNVIVAIKLVIIVVFILAGVWFVKASNWVTPSNPTGALIPPNIGAASVRGDRSSKISHAPYITTLITGVIVAIDDDPPHSRAPSGTALSMALPIQGANHD